MELIKARELFAELKDRISAYNYAGAIASWDLATLAPRKGKEEAAKAIGILRGEEFQILVSSEMKEVLHVFKENIDELTKVEKKEMEIYLEELEQLEKIPKKEYQEFAELQSTAQFIWEEAKEKRDFELFSPYLEKIIYFVRRFAKLKKPQMNPYDCCLNDFEKGLTMKELDLFFGAVKKRTVPLVEKIVKEGRSIREDFVYRSYETEKQKELSLELLRCIGFDFEAGLLAESEHPFTTEINRGDVRLTTHYYENFLTSALLSSIHEGGHGLYEQNAKKSSIIKGSTLTVGSTMGIHESQSRFYENIICRSHEFCEYFYPTIKNTFPEQLKDVSLEEYFEAINISKPGLVRTEADELTYNLHIMIRYELEKALIEGEIEVKDLPQLWSDKYEEYFGVRPEHVSEGVLQDVHWSGGMIGYFPSYALGNAYAAQFYHKMKENLNVEELCRKGDLEPIAAWLNENIHQYGCLKTPGQLIMDITGENLNPDYLMDYLEEKFETIYFK